MAAEQLPLLFFRSRPDADPLAVAESLLVGTPSANVLPLDSPRVLNAVKAARGFARLKIKRHAFGLDNSRLGAVLEGTATETHLRVHFFGDFDKLAEPLFKVLTAEGLLCYSVWDRAILATWPKRHEPTIDKGFADRMARVTERKSVELRNTEPDPKRRARLLDEFVNSPEFRAEMAKAARLEQSRGSSPRAKAYTDLADCYARWRNGRPSASELAAVRKVAPNFASLGITELLALIGMSPRLLLLTAATPRQAAALRASAEQLGLPVDIDLP